MSMKTTAVYIYHGALPALAAAVHKTIEELGLITAHEQSDAASFSLEASEKKGIVTTKWPGKLVIKCTSYNGVYTLNVTADLILNLASAAQELRNHAKLDEFMDMVKAYAPDNK
jgi:hypothetical protein